MKTFPRRLLFAIGASVLLHLIAILGGGFAGFEALIFPMAAVFQIGFFPGAGLVMLGASTIVWMIVFYALLTLSSMLLKLAR